MKFDIHILPAKYGDSIIIEYGNEAKTHKVLIDGGTGGTKKIIKDFIENLPVADRKFDLIVITHIDRDHIEGILSLLEEVELSFTTDDLWFNGWNHLSENNEKKEEEFGSKQGEKLSAAIKKHNISWNKAFNGNAVVIPESGELPVIPLPGGMILTLLSPLRVNLTKLIPKWVEELRKAGLEPGFGLLEQEIEETDDEEESFGTINIEALNREIFVEDDSESNGSSIAFIAEFNGRKILFAADAFPSLIHESLCKLISGSIKIDLVKMSHHASAGNTSPELIEKLNCKEYVISTNGSVYKHPARSTIARVIMRARPNVNLIFNYKSPYNQIWADKNLQKRYNYTTLYPKKEGIIIPLI